ncbi:MAG: peptidoglycan DD-metalloendopeptidase family protein [Acutalibacteraceae bacterium]
MERYNRGNKRKSKREKVGFYLALAICVTAVGLAVWSTYTTYNDLTEETKTSEYISSLNSVAANKDITGVTDEENEEMQTESQTEETTTESASSSAETTESQNAVQTMLEVNTSLAYPFDDVNIGKEYSEEAIYNATMLDYRPHTGVDFSAQKGTIVKAMCNGTITDIRDDEMYGYIITEDCEAFEVYYCGMSKNTTVKKGDTVKQGEQIGSVGQIPCEQSDGEHIHIAVKVKDASYIDPLSVISNDE